MIFGLNYFEFACNFLLYMMHCVFLHNVLTPRFKTPWMILAYCVYAAAVIFGCSLFAKMSILRILLVPVLLSGMTLLMFRDKWLRCVFCSWLVFALAIAVDCIGVLVLYDPEVMSGDLQNVSMQSQILAWMIVFVCTAVFLWIASVILNRIRNRFDLREMMMYIFFPASQGLLLYGWLNSVRMRELSAANQTLLVVVMLFCLAADAGLFLSMIRVSRQKELEMENRFLAEQIDAQRSHYAELTAQYENIRRMRHDITNHIATMDTLLAAGQNSEAADYAARLRAEPSTVGYCENPVVDAFLSTTIQEAEKEGLALDVAVSVPADISIAVTDLVSTYGNLLDNAVEACRGLAGATIVLRSRVSAGYLVISTENPIGPNEGRKTRIQGLERGIGLRVLASLADKYQGNFHYSGENGVFRTEISYRLDV